jgi:hypothetical protein
MQVPINDKNLLRKYTMRKSSSRGVKAAQGVTGKGTISRMDERFLRFMELILGQERKEQEARCLQCRHRWGC